MWLFCRVMALGRRESFLPVVFFSYIYIFFGGFMKRLFILIAAIACSLPALAFKQGETNQDVLKAEVGERYNGTGAFLGKPQSMEKIAEAANAAKVPVDPISLAMSFYKSYNEVMVALVKGGFDAASVIKALVTHSRGTTSVDTLSAALKAETVDGVKLTSTLNINIDNLPATAAGADTQALNANTIVFTGNTVGAASRASTVGGSGTTVTTPISKS
jgi:hypothetical protein